LLQELDFFYESVLLIFERQKESPTDSEFLQIYSYNHTTPTIDVELISGDYKLEAINMLGLGDDYVLDNITIPEREECYRTGLFSENCTMLPEVVFNTTMLSGGVLLDNSTSGFFSVPLSALATNNHLTVYTVGIELQDMDVLEDLENVNKYIEYSLTNRTDLEPEFSMR
jgi:hypothetical protein